MECEIFVEECLCHLVPWTNWPRFERIEPRLSFIFDGEWEKFQLNRVYGFSMAIESGHHLLECPNMHIRGFLSSPWKVGRSCIISGLKSICGLFGEGVMHDEVPVRIGWGYSNITFCELSSCCDKYFKLASVGRRLRKSIWQRRKVGSTKST